MTVETTKKKYVYPFVSLVSQKDMKTALILNVIDQDQLGPCLHSGWRLVPVYSANSLSKDLNLDKFFYLSYRHINILTHVHISACRHIDISTYQHINISTYRHINISTYQNIDVSTYRHIDISSYRHIDISSYRHIVISTYEHN